MPKDYQQLKFSVPIETAGRWQRLKRCVGRREAYAFSDLLLIAEDNLRALMNDVERQRYDAGLFDRGDWFVMLGRRYREQNAPPSPERAALSGPRAVSNYAMRPVPDEFQAFTIDFEGSST
jgi:hypothetical protein